MPYYYIALQSRSHAFILERRLKDSLVECELTYMPREIMRDLCNMGIKFKEEYLRKAAGIINRSGLPGCKVYKETVKPHGCEYNEVCP